MEEINNKFLQKVIKNFWKKLTKNYNRSWQTPSNIKTKVSTFYLIKIIIFLRQEVVLNMYLQEKVALCTTIREWPITYRDIRLKPNFSNQR